MNAPMRMRAVLLDLRRTSTSTSPRAIGSSVCVPMASIDAMPPSDAPTSTGGCGNARGDRVTSPAKASGP